MSATIDRMPVQQRGVVIHPRPQGQAQTTADQKLEEAASLTTSLDVEVVHADIAPLRDIRAATYFAGGKIEEIKTIIDGQSGEAGKIGLVVVNAALTPIQQRNLERAWGAKVIDRTGLILEIFALRAATKEGGLQVELARQTYERSRLVRTWTHLERQRGGQGFLAGPGESQIESDRRILQDRITKLRAELEQVRRTRGLQRTKRERAPERIVALVGYTNAGKSTLFNQLTEGGVYVADQLFATLDTTHRVLALPSGKPAILSDTVGFIADLPTTLVDAFRATLEEVKEADLLLHVRDMSDPLADERREDVLSVLDQIQAGPAHEQPILEVWNKLDLLSPSARGDILDALDAREDAYAISALNGAGLGELLQGVEAALTADDEIVTFRIAPKAYDLRAWLYDNGDVLEETLSEDGTPHVTARLSDVDAGRARDRHPELEVRS